MRVTEGINRILIPTRKFSEVVTFMRDVLGLAVAREGVPVTDTQFSRFAVVELPNGIVLEIVEPTEPAAHLYGAPVLSITVDDVSEARREMESKQMELITPIFDTGDGWGWIYFRGPDGTLYQLQGPYRA